MNAPINYSTRWLEAEAEGRKPVIRTLREIAQRFDIHGRKVVELGSGIGTNLAVFAPDNEVLGVEGMAEAVTVSTSRGIGAVQMNLDAPLSLDDASCDWVLCIDVLEHLVNPQICLAEARRILKPGGGLVVNVPNHFDWKGRLRILFGSGIDSQRYFPDSELWQYPHLRFFDLAAICRLVESEGFGVVANYSDRFGTLPKASLLDRIGLGRLNRLVAARWPNLFGAGFFIVARKRDLRAR